MKKLSYFILFLTLVFGTIQVNAAGDFGAWDITGNHNGMNCGKLDFAEKELTVEFWLYLDEQNGKNIDGTNIASNRHDGSFGFSVGLNKNDKNENKVDLRLFFKTVNNVVYTFWIPREELSNKWNHIAFVVSSNDKKASVYLNTELHDEVQNFNGDWVGNIRANGTNVGDLLLASWYTSPKFYGKMADVRVWNTARSTEEIKANYKKVQSEKEGGLKKYLTFSDELFAQRPVKLAIADNILTWEAEGESWDVEVRSSTDNFVLKSETITQKSYSLIGLDENAVVYVRTINKGFYSGWAFKSDIVKVGCVGDSNTYGAEASDRSKYAWPIQIRPMLGDKYETQNFGKNGALMMDHLNDAWKNQTVYSQNKSYDPDIIVIALGTNDSKDGYWDATKFKTSYINLINEFKSYSADPEIYMAIPIKAYSTTWSINDATIRQSVIPVMREIAKELALPLIDLYSVTNDMADLMASDGIHPKDKGLEIIARKIADIMLMKKPKIVIDGVEPTQKHAAYTWYKNNELIESANEVSYTATEIGTYKVAVKLVTDTDDVVVSKPIEVTIANTKLTVAGENPPSSLSHTQSDMPLVMTYSEYLQIMNGKGSQMTIYSISGQVVKSIIINTNDQVISIQGWNKGIYLCKFNVNNQSHIVKIIR